MPSFGDQGGFATGMGPQPGRPWACHRGEEGAVRPCLQCRPAGGVPGLASGCCESGSDCREQSCCSYLWISNGGCKKRRRKSPSGSFHQQFMAMTTVARTLPPLIASIPWTLPTHCNQVFPGAASLNKTLQ